jgi:hypothetical protein
VPDPKIFTVTLDNVSKPDLQLASVEEKKAAAGENASAAADADSATDDPDSAEDESLTPKRPLVDPVRNEALNILVDLVDLSRTPKTASK